MVKTETFDNTHIFVGAFFYGSVKYHIKKSKSPNKETSKNCDKDKDSDFSKLKLKLVTQEPETKKTINPQYNTLNLIVFGIFRSDEISS